MEQAPLGGIEVVEQLHELRVGEAQIAEPLADMGPVLLFDMGVVVLSIGSGSSELDGVASVLEVPDQVPLEELAPVVAVEAEDAKGERGFDGDDLLQNPGLSLAPDRPLLGPSGGEVGEIEAEDELPGHGVAAMRHGIGFQESGAGLIPLVGFDGDVVLKECAGLGGGEASALNAQARLSKQAVNRGGRDLPQSLLDPGGEDVEGVLIRRNPVSEDRFEALGTGVVSRLPDTA